jgi:phage-related protein
LKKRATQLMFVQYMYIYMSGNMCCGNGIAGLGYWGKYRSPACEYKYSAVKGQVEQEVNRQFLCQISRTVCRLRAFTVLHIAFGIAGLAGLITP